MTRERWDDLVSTIRDAYPILQDGKEQLEDRPGEKEFIEFTGPVGTIRLEYITAAVVIGKRGMGGHKVGAGSSVQYEYSPDETSHKFLAFRQVNGTWQPIDVNSFMPPADPPR